MKLYEAKNIITEVFEKPFDKDKFSYFIRNLLKNLHSAEFRRSGDNIPKAFEDFIASSERLGKYEDEEGNLIDVLIIKLKRGHSIDYARSTQRNFVRWYLNDKGKDAALVAFTTENSSEWRFSFIKMQYSLEKKKDELTPAKRSSFLVGESGNSHTAQRQLIDLLKNDHAPLLSDIEDAFSIEAVSDEFYEKYKALLFNLVDEIEKIVIKKKTVKDEFENKNISILNFSKKLLGQIVFLYFLQKKGWLGLDEKEKYGEGDKNFLRSLFNKTKLGENFFNDYLEYLFYDALSIKRVTDYYERFKTRIPFLNGGLFDPIEFYDWQKTDIIIPNEIFSNRKGDEEGTGILDVFDLYNFTVKEDEPLETEVAIDPEMLGKVFERMLDVTERKSKGAFYTPREIVHYMAQQSLLYFLETELQNEKLRKEDIEKFIHYGEHIIDKDIAVAEGKLKKTAKNQEIPDSIKQFADAIDQALKNIKICDPAVGSGAFPVGIMNEIVKLRKLLTPFLKKESADERSAYCFKSNAIQNSIYGVDIDAGAVEIAKLRLWLSMVVDEERIDTIEPLPNLEYKIVQGNSLINMPDGFLRDGDLEKRIEELTKKYKTITDKEKKQEQKEIIDSKIKQLLASASEFAGYDIDFDFKLFFHEVWNEKEGFDVVIGNPPYITYKGKQKVEVSQNLIDALILNYKNSAEYKINSFALFTELGTRIFNRIGVLTYIIPSTILQNEYLKKIRKLLLTKNNIVEIVTFENKVFKAVTDSLILFVNKELKDDEITLFKRKRDLQFLKEDVVQKFKSSMWKIPPDYVINTKSNHEEDKTIKKIENQNKPLGDLLKVYVGIVAHGIKQFISDKKEDENYKKYLQGRHLNNFTINPAKLFVNFDVSKLHSNTNENVYLKKEKILVRKTGNKLIAAYDNSQYFTDQSIYNLYTDNKKNSISLKYICSLLNSSLLNWYFNKKMITNVDVYPYIKGIHLKKLPIQIKFNHIRKFENIVNYILFCKPLETDKMSFYLEQLLDGMVYELYFEKEIKQAGCDILKYLDDLPEITDKMGDEEKMKIITKVFNKLYDKESPVRKNLFFMDSVEEVAIIKKSLEK